METYCPQQNQSPNTAAPHREPRSAVTPAQLCVTIRNRGDMHLSEHTLVRWSFHVGPHLRPLFWLILSSRCCRIWWVKRWRRMKASMHRGCSRTVETSHSVSSSNEMPPLTPFYQYLQVHKKIRIKTTIHHARTCSCFPMRVEILPKIQVPHIPSFTHLSSPLFLIWPKRLMTFVSWRHPAPDERSGQPHLWTHSKESQRHQLSYLPSTGSWSGTGGKAAYFRSCGNQSWSFQSALMWEWLQPRGPELSHPRGALPHQGDLCCLAPLRWERLQERSFNSVSF